MRDSQTTEKLKTRFRKTAGVVSLFLTEQYGIGWWDISRKLRAQLLDEVEHVPCNLCGRDECTPVATEDKYRLPLTTVICRGCGLLYLNPRPTVATYSRFYEQGGARDSVYHRKIDFNSIEDLLKFYYGPEFVMDNKARAAMTKFMADRGIGPDCKPLAPEETPSSRSAKEINYYAMDLYELLKNYVPVGGKVFEQGASWGKMLQPWKELHRCEATGVEPKKQSVISAKEQLGLELFQGFANDPRIPENTYDLVFNTRTINHMLDPLGDLRNAWRCLKADGILCVDIADAILETRYEGFETNVTEIDHAYLFSEKTLTAMMQKAGFTILKTEVTDLQRVRDWDDRPAQTKQLRLIGRKSLEPVVVDWPDPIEELAALMRSQLEFDRELAVTLDRRSGQLKLAQKKYRALRDSPGGDSSLLGHRSGKAAGRARPSALRRRLKRWWRARWQLLAIGR